MLALDSSGDIFAADSGAPVEYTSTGTPVSSPSLSGSLAQKSLGSGFLANGDQIIATGAAGTVKRQSEAEVTEITLAGSPDPTFTNAPFAIEGQGSGNSSSFAGFPEFEPDGKIVLVGNVDIAPSSTSPSFAIAQLDANGTLDTTFGVRGTEPTQTVNGGEFGASAIQSNGDIVALGSSLNGGTDTESLVFARYIGP